jgi:tetratricopeptide (TPR) repeat protein
MDLDELNEAINARFAGQTLEASDLPRNTPAERAEALCQEAMESFGRRRVILAREAMAEDPNHVDARILLAESTRSAERRIELFQSAKETAAAALGADMEELAGQFWGFHETRPYMRACHGLAAALAEAGQAEEALDEYREMLRLNPNDNQGVRYELVPLLLEQNQDTQARAVLDEYDEPTALWSYLRALIAFRKSGRSAAAKKALHAAFKANPHVVTLLQSDEPPLMPDSYSLGSPEEAAICIEQLQTVWQETEGYMMWMFHEFHTWDRERSKRLRDKRQRERRQKGKRKGRR